MRAFALLLAGAEAARYQREPNKAAVAKKTLSPAELEEKLRTIDKGLHKLAAGEKFSVSAVMDDAAPLLRKLDSILAELDAGKVAKDQVDNKIKQGCFYPLP